MPQDQNKPREQLELRKQALLEELEDIQRLLKDGNDDIPILNEPLDQEDLSDYLSTELPPKAQPPLKEPLSEEPSKSSVDKSVLPGQQALFGDSETKEEKASSETSKPIEEAIENDATAEFQGLVDRLIAHNLPKIEDQLRRKLMQAVEQRLEKNK